MLTVRKIVYQSRNILILASLSTHIPVHRIPAKSVCVCHKRKTFQTLQRNMSITFNKAANCVQRSTHVTDEWKMNLIALCWVSTFLKWVRICIADQKHIQSHVGNVFMTVTAVKTLNSDRPTSWPTSASIWKVFSYEWPTFFVRISQF